MPTKQTTDPVGLCENLNVDDSWWQRPNITIGETGFGAGLNFLTTWAKWQSLAPSGAALHYVSAEANPLSKQSLTKTLSNWPELSEVSTALVDAYPVIHPGFHRLYFQEGRVSLTLLIGDATDMFTQLQAKIDGWYLSDLAFSSTQEALYKRISALSVANVKLVFSTPSKDTERKLELGGIDAQNQLTCEFSSTPPWFAPPPPLRKGSTIAIIGGGIAGISCYHATARAGFKPVLYERSHELATGGSGNPVGLIQPRLTTSDSLDGQFNATTYLNSIRHYDGLEKDSGDKLWHGARGGIQLARNEIEEARYKKLVESARLPAPEMSYLSATEMSAKAGINIKKPGLYYSNAGALRPKQLVDKLAEGMNITFGADIASLHHQADRWCLLDRTGKNIATVDAVILANSHDATTLTDIRDVPLTAKRGQISFVPATKGSHNQQCGVSYGNYVTPCFVNDDGQRFHVVGASYRALEGSERFEAQEIASEDHQKNLNSLGEISDSYGTIDANAQIHGRAAIRATTIDHLPVVGPIHLGDKVDEIYHDLRHGKATHSYPPAPYQTGLYCMTGLGSRGFQTAPILATALADMLAGLPNTLEKRFLNAIHPIRFQIRKLKRKTGR